MFAIETIPTMMGRSNPEQMKEEALQRYTFMPGSFKEQTPRQDIAAVTINGLNGLTSSGTCNHFFTNANMEIVQTMLWNDRVTYFLWGIAPAQEMGSYRPIFKQMIDSFKLEDTPR